MDIKDFFNELRRDLFSINDMDHKRIFAEIQINKINRVFADYIKIEFTDISPAENTIRIYIEITLYK